MVLIYDYCFILYFVHLDELYSFLGEAVFDISYCIEFSLVCEDVAYSRYLGRVCHEDDLLV